jgi:hypothetical protein
MCEHTKHLCFAMVLEASIMFVCVCVCVCVFVCERTLEVFSPLKFMLQRDRIKKVQSPLVETMFRSTVNH